jgi:hypothetical protein
MLGPHIPDLTLLLIPAALLGMGTSMFLAGRHLVRRAASRGLVEAPRSVRWRLARPARRRLEVAARPHRPRSLRDHALAGLILVSMILVAVGLLTLMPVAVIWFASQLSSTTAPGTFPYLLVAVGIGLGALIGARLLAGLQSWHAKISGIEVGPRRPTAWLRSLSDTDWERDPGAVVEWLMVATIIVALVSFAVWLLAFADLSRMVPQELQPG